MALESFGYLGIRSDKLDEWAAYAPGVLGLGVAAEGLREPLQVLPGSFEVVS